MACGAILQVTIVSNGVGLYTVFYYVQWQDVLTVANTEREAFSAIWYVQWQDVINFSLLFPPSGTTGSRESLDRRGALIRIRIQAQPPRPRTRFERE